MGCSRSGFERFRSPSPAHGPDTVLHPRAVQRAAYLEADRRCRLVEPRGCARCGKKTALAANRRGQRAVASPDESKFEVVAEEVFRRYSRRWKHSTLKVNRWYLSNQTLLWFKGRQIVNITRKDVQDWPTSLRETLVAADRSAPVLSVIMVQAEVYGNRPEITNPCRCIRRYRRKVGNASCRKPNSGTWEVSSRCMQQNIDNRQPLSGCSFWPVAVPVRFGPYSGGIFGTGGCDFGNARQVPEAYGYRRHPVAYWPNC